MFLWLGLALTLVCRGVKCTIPGEVHEFTKSVGDSVNFLTDVQGLEAKIQHTAEFMKQFHDMSTDPQKEFTWDEVGRCDGEDGRPIYIVIDNTVYDITEFAEYHPPGPEPLKVHAGKDATTAVKVMNINIFGPVLHYFQVGKIVNSQKDNSTGTQSLMKNTIEPRLS